MVTGSVLPGRSIRVAWRRIFAGLCVLVVALGTASFGLALAQRSMFDGVTSQFRTEVGTTVEVSSEMRNAERPMGAVLYEFGTDAELRDALARFQRSAERVASGLAVADELAPSERDRRHLATARTSWEQVVAVVDDAPAAWGTGTVQEALASGSDPYLATWDALSAAQAALNEYNATSVERLGRQTDLVDARLRVLLPALLVSIFVSLAIVLQSGRRLTQQLISPIVAITAVARRMRSGDLDARPDLDRSEGRLKELGELSQAMNALARSLAVSHAELQVQATTDPLTGLPNRRALQEQLEQRVAMDDDRGFALLFIDLDDFKVVNDTLGHAAGDTLLRVVAERLRSSSRGRDLVARVGGDEFAVLVEPVGGSATVDLAESLAQRILSALERPIQLEDGAVTTGCSIGIAEAAAGAEAEEVLRNADVAMYLAKSRGKNCFERCAPATHAAILRRLELKRDLRRVVDAQQLELQYQRVVDVDSSELIGLEALVRWRHPTLGLLPPAEFIGLAEDTGDIVAIGAWVLEQACRDLRDLRSTGRVEAATWVSVNVSGRQLEPTFGDTVRDALAGLPPSNLVLEVAEGVLATRHEVAVEVLGRLQQDGFRVAVDDFGSGLPFLRHLQELPLDIIKLDRSFTAAPHAADRAAALEAIIGLGHKLGLSVIAEGIEDQEQLRRLHQLGHLGGQGFLLGRPAPLAAVELRPLVVTPAGRLDFEHA